MILKLQQAVHFSMMDCKAIVPQSTSVHCEHFGKAKFGEQTLVREVLKPLSSKRSSNSRAMEVYGFGDRASDGGSIN